MQAFREELKDKDAESLKRQREYDARIQEVEARLQQRAEGRSHPTEECRGQQPELDEHMKLITPEVAVTLSVAAQKQKAVLAEDLEYNNKTSAGRHGKGRRISFQNEKPFAYDDVEMDSDGDRRNAGIVQFESATPEPGVGFS